MEGKDNISVYHCLSPHLKSDYDSLGFSSDKMKVIPHFYDKSFYNDPSDDETKVDVESPTVLTVGRLEEKKGVQDLIRALPQIVENGYTPTVRIIGSGSYENKLRKLADALGVDEYIVWKGFVDYERLPKWYSESDLFVYPGLWDEPFGRVFLEAMASQTPVLSSEVGSVEYILGNAGLTYEPGSSSQLATRFDEILSHYDKYKNEIPSQLRKFDKKAIVKQFRNLYMDVSK
ncbi:glycosyltransferase family 4 protein [Haloprofundus marisrubri]|nr:glycosyltransferase family 4 protein [Haloprofundus marisrubri]